MNVRSIDQCIAQKRAERDRIASFSRFAFAHGKMMRDAFESKASTRHGVKVAQRNMGVCIPASTGILLLHSLLMTRNVSLATVSRLALFCPIRYVLPVRSCYVDSCSVFCQLRQRCSRIDESY